MRIRCGDDNGQAPMTTQVVTPNDGTERVPTIIKSGLAPIGVLPRENDVCLEWHCRALRKPQHVGLTAAIATHHVVSTTAGDSAIHVCLHFGGLGNSESYRV